MLDWFSGYVGYDGSRLETGRFFELDRHGEVTRQVPRWDTAVGSFAAGVQVTKGIATEQMVRHSRELGFLCSPAVLRVSGNPSKFLQGHNAAGPSVSHLGPILQAMVRQFGDGFRPPDADDPRLPAVQRSRVDVTTGVDLGAHQAVHDWLDLAARSTRSRHGRAIDSMGTVYWGKHSTRWSLKAYCKHCELIAHPPRWDVVPGPLFDSLLDWTSTQLRVELTLRRPELKIRGSLDESIIWEFMNRLEIHSMKKTDIADATLRPVVRAALQLWLDGHDIRSCFPRMTLYRYRKEILAATGTDVTLPRAPEHQTAEAKLLGVDELRAREVKNVPEQIEASLYAPQKATTRAA